MKHISEKVSVCIDSTEATVCHHDCKSNISLAPNTVTKAIKRSLLPGGGRRRGRGYIKVHFQAPSNLSLLKRASLSWKPPPIG